MRSQSHERLWPPLLKLKFGNGWLTTSSYCCGNSCKKFNSSFQFQFQFQFQGFQFQFHFQFHQFKFQFQFQFWNWNWNWASIPIPELNWPQPWTLSYCQTSNISHTIVLVGNEIVDHSDVVGAAPTSWNSACRCCSNYIFILGLTPGFNGLGKDNLRQDEKHLSFGIWCGLY